MTIQDIVKAVATDTKCSQTAARAAVDAVFGAIKASLAAGEDVQVHAFGKFALKVRAARTARNPQTGKPVQVPERNVVKFTPAKALKDAV